MTGCRKGGHVVGWFTQKEGMDKDLVVFRGVRVVVGDTERRA